MLQCNKSLLSVNTTPRWTDDPINVIKVGLNTVKYMECDNERDMWWGGPATVQTAAEYAADMSAFYDGDMGKLGKNVGVKTADPNMIVVMGGLAQSRFYMGKSYDNLVYTTSWLQSRWQRKPLL